MTEHPALFTAITNEPKDYAWGAIDGIATVLGRPGSGRREAELWFGAHASGASRAAVSGQGSWADLAEWEAASGERLPYLLKILCAAAPLSIQAHPTLEQARAGFDREEAFGIPLDARHRNYKDPYAKPELIVALRDGFEALCGFRPVVETIDAIDELAASGVAETLLAPWRERLSGEPDPSRAFDWLLSGLPVVAELVAAVGVVAARGPRGGLVARLAAACPGDAGILVALMMNHVVLAAGEAIWLPAGNVHAYLRGDGVELMGPSDNVLRGGLTPKHIDTAELARVLDFSTGAASLLASARLDDGVLAYRPRAVESGSDVPFELLAVDSDAELALQGASIAVVTDGSFAFAGDGEVIAAPRGTAVFVARASTVTVTGRGRLFVATAPTTRG
ncbi:mannose-6-phosphate isomerase, class I [Agromyces sp. SYSU K20354]|uniref:mannose-6-phosphate isomerase, class I n=1 Tax=Agromyces cavernae TaxID=2898659 RepID=UPI001E3D52AC|nr:mannose-6-phosphate isomerase, class I [Agromyces cavernae]MCD2440893.1 mannose-6-phosphate isomerase, class I [Agromyces cavernae]